MSEASLNPKPVTQQRAVTALPLRSLAAGTKRGIQYPVVSFRSALIKAQRRYPPAQAVTARAAQAPSVQNTPAQAAAAPFSAPNPNPIGPIKPLSGVGEGPMALADFPRPVGDNGRGMHWVPTVSSPTSVVDRFVQEAKEMKVKWMVILNNDAKVGENDYLVKKLTENGIMPIMRIYTPEGRPIKGDVTALVKHYKALGVSYYQLYNEPNLNGENPDGVPNVGRYLDRWLPAAKAVIAGGGLPGLGALSPGGNFDDYEFLKQTFDKIKERGEIGTLDNAWLSMHNYTFNHPIDYMKDSNGFMKFKWYDAIVREKLGRQMPIVGTEGGTFVDSAEDRTFPAVDEGKRTQMVTDAYKYMRNREPYNFAYTYWIIANEEGGGADPSFTKHAIFRPGYHTPLVDALKALA